MIGAVILPIVSGVCLALIYIGLLMVQAIGRFSCLSGKRFFFVVIGTLVRLSIVALAVVGMLRYSLSHLILMMVAFYTAMMLILIAYKGVR